MIRSTLLAVVTLLAACGGPELRVPAPPPLPEERIAIRYRSIEVREVSMPSYAALEEIYLRGEDGLLVAADDLWADDPTRAVTLGLTRALATITGAEVAPEPWPFDSFPSVRIDVRVEDLLTDAAGNVRMAGQVFVAPDQGRGRDAALFFDLATQVVPPVSPASLAVARTALIEDLAALIARDGLR